MRRWALPVGSVDITWLFIRRGHTELCTFPAYKVTGLVEYGKTTHFYLLCVPFTLSVPPSCRRLHDVRKCGLLLSDTLGPCLVAKNVDHAIPYEAVNRTYATSACTRQI